MKRQQENLSLNLILSCLSLVEQYVPRMKEMPRYRPNYNFDPCDIQSLLYEAESMMIFIGLKNIAVTIAFVETEENNAGNINLNNNNKIHININRKILTRRKRNELILAILAHEICHKLLHVKGLVMSDTKRNEICTDLATIYVGFGLLTIHGCIEENTRVEYPAITKEIYQVGYLTPRSYILAYIVVARSYGFKNSELGIVSDGEFLRNQVKLAKKDAIRFKLYSTDEVKEHFIEQSKKIARNKRNIIILQYLLKRMELEMESCYKQLDNRYNRLILSDGSLDMHPIAALHVMKCKAELVSYVPSEKCISYVTEKIYKCLKHVDIEELERVNRFIICPICGQKSNKELSSNCNSIQKCKKCGGIFYWDSSQYHKKTGGIECIKHFFIKLRKRIKTYL